ncbi:hypothetical protein B0H10DRAFT_1939586 [Mycena sp. CBHHK59/15]|nr:hypothetical protein B0H10DRAFT_1939586 [Mycena sp. CBHHK59/15]
MPLTAPVTPVKTGTVGSPTTDSSSNSAQAPGDSDAEGSRGAGDSDSGAAGAAVDSDPDSAETRITWADEGYTLDWAPDGTVVVKNADDLYEGWTSVDAITTIASGGQFLHTSQSTATTGIGRLAVANPVPPDSNQIYLGKPTTGAFLLATDGKDVYYLVYCDYGEQRREVFLVLDPSTALAILEADTSSGEVEFCAFAFFTQETTPAST